MGKVIGRMWLNQKYPQITDDELDHAFENVQNAPSFPVKQTSIDYDKHRRKFIAAAWLLGASQAKLGQMFDIAQQTVNNHLNRALRKYDRVQLRFRPPKMSLLELGALKEAYYAMLKKEPTVFDDYDAVQLALVLQHVNVNVTEPDHADAYGGEKLSNVPEVAQPEPSAAAIQPMSADNFWDKMKGVTDEVQS